MSPARNRTSAGLLPVRVAADGTIEVFIAHLGGPFWARKDARAWSIVKGEYDPGAEDPEAAAEREWVEETGTPAPAGRRFDLGSITQSGGKAVRAYAVHVAAGTDVALRESNQVTMEWPPRSVRQVTFPEIDRADWCDLPTARTRLVAAQSAFLDRLEPRA